MSLTTSGQKNAYYKTSSFIKVPPDLPLSGVGRLRVGWLHGVSFITSMPAWEEFRESKRCPRDTYPESYISECALSYEKKGGWLRSFGYPEDRDQPLVQTQ